MAKPGDQRPPEDSFGAHLARLRIAAGLSLRDVEEATDHEVSNAYLSQLEKSKITKPSPHILYALAPVLKTSYEDLMKRAGYITSDQDGRGRKQTKVAAFAVQDLTPEEERSLLDYLAMIRKQKRK
ncbi:MAG TPA: helix-turn-helix transcriptional regulator [Edaphobacter sp.]|uniref:helix-turn-helix domain-containing protein n=1 Tax=Edaphobacter sp. TaxID=1934404 RepID=UPI002BB483D4|nr:helix-turn-helix transcriptional regulator [Edaphobacter sp.]HUZ96438.1 helix-turn-helix transcriptional regulator [Edaphobacter sp.]